MLAFVDSTMHGTPNWASLKSKDTHSAKNFYSKIFGWNFNYKSYINSEIKNASIAKFADTEIISLTDTSSTPELIESLWESYVFVDDLDQILLKTIEAEGRIIHRSHSVGTIGRAAMIEDPSGAKLCAWEASENIRSRNKSGHGSLSWLELETSNIDTAKEFYNYIFGWEASDVWMPPSVNSPEWCYTIFSKGSNKVAGAIKPPINSIYSSWCAAFSVLDADIAARTVREIGGIVVTEPYDIPIGRQAVLMDPNGAVFSVVALNKRTK